MADVLELNAATGEVVERDYTPDELKQRKADEKAAKEQAKQEAAEEAARAETRAAAIQHAKSLGFTDEMIAVMYPGLVGSEK